jgi:hypothetical protein
VRLEWRVPRRDPDAVDDIVRLVTAAAPELSAVQLRDLKLRICRELGGRDRYIPRRLRDELGKPGARDR